VLPARGCIGRVQPDRRLVLPVGGCDSQGAFEAGHLGRVRRATSRGNGRRRATTDDTADLGVNDAPTLTLPRKRGREGAGYLNWDRSTLPIALRGIASMKRTTRGHL